MIPRRFSQVDVFSTQALRGNPLAVVHDAEGLSEETMAAFARWTNLSETTFLLPPTTGEADYRVRIFTPGGELPFAGHPTLGSAHAWLAAGGRSDTPGTVVQECGIGLVRVRREGRILSFAAPELLRSGPVEPAEVERVSAACGLRPDQVLDAAWVDNGPGWLGLRLDSADTVLSLRPDLAALGDVELGVLGAHPAGGPADVEVRAFVPSGGVGEDPVTGSLNAGLAVWLIGAGVLPDRYTAAQGTVLGRAGRVEVSREGDAIWVGGAVTTVVGGEVELP